MKKIFLTVAATVAVLSAYGQGTVNFNTAALNDPTTKITDSTGTPLSGTAAWAQLYAAAGANQADSTLKAFGTPVNFRAGVNAGYVQSSGTAGGTTVNPSVNLLSGTANGAVTVEIRAWLASAGSTYEAALASGTGFGKSAPLTITSTGGGDPAAGPPNLPANLTGIKGFALTGGAVPEPSTIALGILGVGALLLRRRK